MRYQIIGIVEYFKMVSKIFTLRLILRINLRSKFFNFLQRIHGMSIFALEKAQS